MIKNLIFDFGNVLFDLELGRISSGLAALYGEQSAAARERLQRDRIFELLETGGISADEFVGALCHAVHPPLRPEQALEVWNSIFLRMPRERFEMLLRLRQRYPVFLLSNINEIHERWIADYMRREHGITDFEARFFDGVYYSHLVRLRKPDREIYEYVLADAELKPHETLFVDDLPENVEAARSVGIHAVVHTPHTDPMRTLEAFFANYSPA